MKKILIAAAVILLPVIAVIVSIAVSTKPVNSQETQPLRQEIKVFFSPKGGCTDVIVKEIGSAKKQVLVQAYSFTSADIANALLDAKKRDVQVEVILDAGQETAKYSSATFFHNTGVPLFIDERHAIAHNKIMVIDGDTVITGSFNFTKAAEESNAENLVILKGFGDVTKKYLENYEVHKAHSRAYERPAQKKKP